MDLGVAWVLELLEHVSVLRRGSNLLGLLHRALHALGRVRQHQLGTESLEKNPPLHRHGRRHGQHELVPERSSDERQPNPRVPRGGLHQSRLPCRDLPLVLRLRDHVIRDPILDRVARVHALHLHRNRPTASLAHLVQENHGSLPNEFGHVVRDVQPRRRRRAVAHRPRAHPPRAHALALARGRHPRRRHRRRVDALVLGACTDHATRPVRKTFHRVHVHRTKERKWSGKGKGNGMGGGFAFLRCCSCFCFWWLCRQVYERRRSRSSSFFFFVSFF
mmetsp:Transcript_5467/g.16573  ORF Transcript_5467/g.16573 Transcript_5467/m.16573 type:complete len:276 (-) Transcript_5467:179-1006(-)